MVHCTGRPPQDLVVVSYGDQSVYAIAPARFKDLKSIAREEFDLVDTEFDVYSSCINKCGGTSARIGERVWGHIKSDIGCLSIVPKAVSVFEDSQRPSSAINDPTATPEQPYYIVIEDSQPPSSPCKKRNNSDDEGAGCHKRLRSGASIAPVESSRFMISVFHPPSDRKRRFTVRSSTKVSKVISTVCRCFKLATSSAALYLIMETDGEDYSLCDMEDTITKAGARPGDETRYLLVLPGDPVPKSYA